MSFLKSLFGGGRSKDEHGPAAAPTVAKEIEHNGFLVQATPFKEAGQYQTSGVVSKVIDGVRKEHRFIRADRFASLDDAVDCALAKGRLMVDQEGESLFQ
jgi:hypothetical protein